jgi:hypothetical protein
MVAPGVVKRVYEAVYAKVLSRSMICSIRKIKT